MILSYSQISILIRYRYDTFLQKYRNFDTDTIVSKGSAKLLLAIGQEFYVEFCQTMLSVNITIHHLCYVDKSFVNWLKKPVKSQIGISYLLEFLLVPLVVI